MLLRGVEVTGFRSLRNSEVNGLTTVSSIVGRNNAGKTALFEALLLLETLRHGDVRLEALQHVLPWGRSIEEVVKDSLTGRTHPGDIQMVLRFIPTAEELAIVLGGKVVGTKENVSLGVSIRYDLTLKSGSPQWPECRFVPNSVAIRQGNKDYPLFDLVDLRGADVTYRAPADGSLQGALRANEPRTLQFSNHSSNLDSLIQRGLDGREQPCLNLLLEWVRGLRFIGHSRQSGDRIALTTSHLLKSDGSNLPRYFQHLLNNEPRKWDQLKAVFQELVPWLRDVFSPISEAETSIRIAVDQDQDALNAFELSNMGAGTTHLMAIIAMVWSAPSGSLCLIDEPEQGLHSSAQRDLALWLEWHAGDRAKQVLLATHSTIFANPSLNRSVFLATYTPEEGTKFRPVEEEETSRITTELGVRFADFFAYDYLLLVDGETEFAALPVIATALGMDFGALSIRFLPLFGDAKTRLKRLEDYLSYLRGTQVNPYVILDADPGVRGALDALIDQGLLADANVWLWSRRGHPGEFEDNLSDEQLVTAANAMARSAGVQAEGIALEELASLRREKPRTATSKLLNELYFRQYGYTLPKVELAKQIARIISSDIAEGNRDYEAVQALERVRESVTSRT